jgi:hypothetical protein
MKYECDTCGELVGTVYHTNKGALCERCYDDLEDEDDDSV